MKTRRNKKLSATVKAVIVLAVLAVVFFSLALASAVYSVDRTIKAIDGIGTVEYTAESRKRIETAVSYYHALDENLGLRERVTNVDALTSAKVKYVSLAVWEVHLADEENQDGQNDAKVSELIADARSAYELFFDYDASADIPNFFYLTEAESKYGSGNSGQSESPSDDGQTEDDIELC